MTVLKIDEEQARSIARQVHNSIFEYCRENAEAFEAFKKTLNCMEDCSYESKSSSTNAREHSS